MTNVTAQTVCILDSDTDVCAMLTDMLADAGYTSICAQPDADGVALLAHSQPALVILEMNPRHPDVSSHIVEQIRSRSHSAPSIVISSTDAELLAALHAQLCALHYWPLPRPFTYEELLAVVTAAIGTPERLSEGCVGE
jgi:DNA-binding response OmpR family regulator